MKTNSYSECTQRERDSRSTVKGGNRISTDKFTQQTVQTVSWINLATPCQLGPSHHVMADADSSHCETHWTTAAYHMYVHTCTACNMCAVHSHMHWSILELRLHGSRSSAVHMLNVWVGLKGAPINCEVLNVLSPPHQS